MIAGLTLGDTVIEIKSKNNSKEGLSFGIPDRWGTAAITYSLLEGLAGMKDSATIFERVKSRQDGRQQAKKNCCNGQIRSIGWVYFVLIQIFCKQSNCPFRGNGDNIVMRNFITTK